MGHPVSNSPCYFLIVLVLLSHIFTSTHSNSVGGPHDMYQPRRFNARQNGDYLPVTILLGRDPAIFSCGERVINNLRYAYTRMTYLEHICDWSDNSLLHGYVILPRNPFLSPRYGS